MSLTVFSEPELICRRSSVRLSVMFVRPTQAIKIFGSVSTPFGTLAIRWPFSKNFTEMSQGNPFVGGELNARGVAKYNDFGPVASYISETVQDRS